MPLPPLALRSLAVLAALSVAVPALTLIGRVPAAVAVIGTQMLFLVAAARFAVPSARRGAALAAVAALAADALLLGGEGVPLGALGAVLGLTVAAVFALQLARRDGRPHVTASAASAMTAALVVIAGSCWLVAAQSPPAGLLPLVALAILLGGVLALVPEGARGWSCLLAVAAGAAVGATAAPTAGVLAAAVGALLALGTTGVLSLVGGNELRRVDGLTLPERASEGTLATVVVAGTLPLLLAGPLTAVLTAGLGG